MTTQRENESIDSRSLSAARTVFVAAQLEKMKLFEVADTIAELFGYGTLPVSDAATGKELHDHMSSSSERLSAYARRQIYARAVGVFDDAELNNEFNRLFLRFVSSVLRFAQMAEGVSLEAARQLDQASIRSDGRALAANLSQHLRLDGFAHACRLEVQIRNAMRLVSNQHVLEVFDARDPWTVIERVAHRELGGSADVVMLRRRAQAGATILGWLAERCRRFDENEAVVDARWIETRTDRAGYLLAPAKTDGDLVDACLELTNLAEDIGAQD